MRVRLFKLDFQSIQKAKSPFCKERRTEAWKLKKGTADEANNVIKKKKKPTQRTSNCVRNRKQIY